MIDSDSGPPCCAVGRVVDRSTSVARRHCRRDFASGDWTPGMRLPTEAELAKSLPYSLGTVQKAYSELVKNGLVERARGRGSFVAPLQRQMSEPLALPISRRRRHGLADLSASDRP